jgi:hypothetical protein
MLEVRERHVRGDEAVNAARLLGYAGLIPFAALPLIELMSDYVSEELLSEGRLLVLFYGVVILSFMSGCRWALRVIDPEQGALAPFAGFLGAVAPPLIAWVLVLLPEASERLSLDLWLRFTILAGLLVVVFLQDLAHRRQGGPLPDWYWHLRIHLTAGAAGSILLGVLIAAFA